MVIFVAELAIAIWNLVSGPITTQQQLRVTFPHHFSIYPYNAVFSQSHFPYIWHIGSIELVRLEV
ncbi:hypothetical protein COLO4_24375 [Corchorus olitorius]|uniref:Uncharacterized protein n=1 Tax=Corchorus olitorius TaxID=93759 RepID=A0A1R3IAK2_9ROSI|nr:hypothetical protein COLO4_24375 [Corchorus olitorius]